MKKILSILFLLIMGVTFVFGEDFPYDVQTPTDTTDPVVEYEYVNSDNSAIKGIAEDYVGEDTLNEDSPFITYVSKIINYFLGILSFIAFLVLLNGFSLVILDGSDSGMKKGYKYIKIATISIIIIGISWLISIWFINIYTQHIIGS